MFIIKTWWIEGGFPELLTMETDAKVIEFYVRIYSAPYYTNSLRALNYISTVLEKVIYYKNYKRRFENQCIEIDRF